MIFDSEYRFCLLGTTSPLRFGPRKADVHWTSCAPNPPKPHLRLGAAKAFFLKFPSTEMAHLSSFEYHGPVNSAFLQTVPHSDLQLKVPAFLPGQFYILNKADVSLEAVLGIMRRVL